MTRSLCLRCSDSLARSGWIDLTGFHFTRQFEAQMITYPMAPVWRDGMGAARPSNASVSSMDG